MTYRELAQEEHPELIWELYEGGVHGCPSDILNGAKDLCERGHLKGSEGKCSRCWDQEISDQTGKSANAGKGGTMITLNLDRDDIKNLIEFFDLSFFDHLKYLLEDGNLDNMAYLGSMAQVYDELNRALGEDDEEE